MTTATAEKVDPMEVILDELEEEKDKNVIIRAKAAIERLNCLGETDAVYKLANTFTRDLYTLCINPQLSKEMGDEPQKGVLVYGAPRPPLRVMLKEILTLVIRVVFIYQRESRNEHFMRLLFKILLDRLEEGLKKIGG